MYKRAWGELIVEEKMRALLLDSLAILFGCSSLAVGLDVFVVPNQIAPGGVSGLAVVIASLIPLRIGVLSLLLNLPLLIVALWVMGLRSLIKTLSATVVLTVAIDGLALVLPAYTNNVLLAAVLGGVLTGIGVGVLFLRGISTGGTDLLSLLLLRPFPNLPVGKLLLFIDASVVLVAVLVFQDIEVAMYSIVTLFVCAKVIDGLMEGMNYAKVIYIITDKEEDMRIALNTRAQRGVTALPARGGYTGQKKSVIMSVTRRNVMAQTIRVIKETDPAAFLFVVNAAEVHGQGFKWYTPVA